MTPTQFDNLLEQLKNNGYHIFYSSVERWVWVSYKQWRELFDLSTDIGYVSNLLNFKIKPVK
jgi:hypothetical protein